MPPRALILGISGQDGAYLARFLLRRGYEVHGTSRDAQVARFAGLTALGIYDAVQLSSTSPVDFHSVAQAIERAEPDEIYNLAAQSSVALSFTQPAETIDSIIKGTLTLLEAVRLVRPKARFYNAASSECFATPTASRPTRRPHSGRRSLRRRQGGRGFLVANYRDPTVCSPARVCSSTMNLRSGPSDS